MGNKVQYGIKNCHYCVATTSSTGAVTYTSLPVALPGAKSISVNAEGETSTFYADNTAYWVGVSNNGYTGSLELANIDDAFFKNVLGFVSDTNGNLVEKADSKPVECALLFEFDGDVKAKRHCLYYCKFTRPSLESSTVEASIEPNTQTIEFSAIPLPNTGIIKSTTSDSTTTTAYNAWFTGSLVVPTISE